MANLSGSDREGQPYVSEAHDDNTRAPAAHLTSVPLAGPSPV
jgi:hypothetical protein